MPTYSYRGWVFFRDVGGGVHVDCSSSSLKCWSVLLSEGWSGWSVTIEYLLSGGAHIRLYQVEVEEWGLECDRIQYWQPEPESTSISTSSSWPRPLVIIRTIATVSHHNLRRRDWSENGFEWNLEPGCSTSRIRDKGSGVSWIWGPFWVKPGTGCSTSSIHSDTVLLFTILSIGILTGTASHWHVYTYI